MILPAFTFPSSLKVTLHQEDTWFVPIMSIHVRTEESKLIWAAELSADNLNIVEDDIIDLNIKGQVEIWRVINLNLMLGRYIILTIIY